VLSSQFKIGFLGFIPWGIIAGLHYRAAKIQGLLIPGIQIGQFLKNVRYLIANTLDKNDRRNKSLIIMRAWRFYCKIGGAHDISC